MVTVINIHAADEAVRAINMLISELEERRTLSESDLYTVKLIAHELISNSIKHAQTTASLLYKLKCNLLMMCVLDEGDGFEMHDMCCLPDVYDEGGRGIYLAECYSESLRYNKKGNAVIAHIRIG